MCEKKINSMLLYQAMQIANNYSVEDVNLCISVLNDRELVVLNKYLYDMQETAKLKITEDRIIRAIALIVDKQTANLVKTSK